MKYYDYKKAREIIDRQENLSSACLGMHEDWFWTAAAIWENGAYTKKFTDNFNGEICGINGSKWATPTLQLVFKDGTDKMIEVSTGENDCSGDIWNWANGALSGPVQERITPLSEE